MGELRHAVRIPSVASRQKSGRGRRSVGLSRLRQLNVVDGCIPSDMAAGSVGEIEEERRLPYVAMTRARNELHLLIPLRFSLIIRRGLVVATSMLCVAGSFRRRSWITSSAGAWRRATRTRPVWPRPERIDLSAKFRDMWRSTELEMMPNRTSRAEFAGKSANMGGDCLHDERR